LLVGQAVVANVALLSQALIAKVVFATIQVFSQAPVEGLSLVFEWTKWCDWSGT
jgi:hypothetical protein